MKKAFVTTPKVGTGEHWAIEGTGSPPMMVNGRSVPARPCQYIWFRSGLFVADSEKKYRIHDDIQGEVVIDQLTYMEQHPHNVANGGHAFREHEPWMDKVDAARLLQAGARSMSDEAFLAALHKIEAMPEGKPRTKDAVQVHVGVRDAGAKGVSLEDVEPDYGNLEKILAQMAPASPEFAAAVKDAMRRGTGE